MFRTIGDQILFRRTVYPALIAASFSEQCRHYSKVRKVSPVSYVKIANRVKVNIRTAATYTLPTRLATANPLVSAEWDYERNPGHVYPKIVGCGDITPYWWRCAECGSHFKMSVEQRVLRKGGCEACKHATTTGIPQEDLLEGEEITSSAMKPEDSDELLEGETNSRRPLNIRPRPKIGD